jgi:protein TonB
MINDSSNLYGSEWLALVFNNRNKKYGAYVLRLQSSRILLRALFIVAPIFIMFFVSPMIYAALRPPQLMATPVVYDPTTIDAPIHENIKKEEETKPKEQEAAKPAPTKPVEVNTLNMTDNFAIVDEPKVEPPTSAQVNTSVISNETKSGDGPAINAIPNGTGTGEGTAKEGEGKSDEILDVMGVEQYPEFPGGMEAWAKFIQRNLRYPYTAQDAGVQGKVFVSFVVEKDGSISDVKVARGLGYGLDDEAVRVIKKSPKWKAGMQNKQTVRVRYNMPINYVLQQ